MVFGSEVMYVLLFLTLFFEVFMLMSFLEQRFRKPQVSLSAHPMNEATMPRVAIVVPCYNEEATVISTIESLLALDYPKDKIEIHVVDDGSTDGTRAAIARYEHDPRIHVYHKENGGKHTGMNLALENTSAELIGCLDADSIVASDALRKIVPIFSNHKIAAVTPGIHVRNPQNTLQQLQHVEYRLSIFNRFMYAALGSVFITPGPFSFFRASVVRELGGWRYAHSTEDMEMALRIQTAGHLIANCPQAIVHTATPETLSRLFRQRVRWTYGWLRNAIDYYYMFGNHRYGNLGLLTLPFAILSIFTGIYFFARILASLVVAGYHKYEQVYYGGFNPGFSSINFDLFYINTSALLLLVWVSVALIFTLICIGSLIGTGSKKPPMSTPLFLILYSFLVPLWLSVAVVRAVFRTGVRWR